MNSTVGSKLLVDDRIVVESPKRLRDIETHTVAEKIAAVTWRDPEQQRRQYSFFKNGYWSEAQSVQPGPEFRFNLETDSQQEHGLYLFQFYSRINSHLRSTIGDLGIRIH